MATLGHLLDGNTLALWRMDEALAATNLADQTGAYSLSRAGSPQVVGGLISDGGNARRILVNGDVYNGTGNAAMQTALASEFTIEAWAKLDAYGTVNDTRMIDIISGDRAIWFSINQTGHLQTFWQTSGVSKQYDEPSNVLALATRYHVAMRKLSAGGGNYFVDVFINGVKVGTSGNFANTTSGANPNIALCSGSGGAPFLGTLDDVRVSKVARTDAEIADSFWRGLIDRQSPQFGVPALQSTTSQDFQNYQDALSPTALQGATGTLFESSFGSMKDLFADRVRASIKSRLPQNAPPDALTQIGTERGMPQGQSESGTAYAARLQDAWNAWPWAGTAFGLLRAFYATGYTNVVLAQVRGGKQFTLDTGATNTFLWSTDLSNAAWNKRGTCAVTKNATTAPDGTTTAAQITGLGAATASDLYQTVGSGGNPNGTPYNLSFWIKRISATGTVSAGNPNDAAGMSIDLAAIGAGWVRIDPGVPVTGVTVGTPFTIRGGSCGIQLYASIGAPLSFYFWMPQNEIGVTAAGAVTPTYSVAKSTALAAGSLLTATMGSGLWETDVLSALSPVNQSFWSKFDVVLPLPLMPPSWSWSGGIPSSSSAESNFIRALIQAWKPAHATVNRIVIVQQGSVWGYPAAQLWGASTGLWGGSANTVWVP